MPQFKIAKTNDKQKLDDNFIYTDKLYIYKETNKLGRLFFDYDDNTRIVIDISKLGRYVETGGMYLVGIDELQINSLVSTTNALYNIRHIDRVNEKITVVRLHIQRDLTWNDYYEEDDNE